MASVCVELRMAPPEYWNLRVDEFDAILTEMNRRARQQARVALDG